MIVAAVVIVHRCALHTLNRRHYGRIASLSLHEMSGMEMSGMGDDRRTVR